MIDFDKLNRIAQNLGIEIKRASHKGSNLKFIDNEGHQRVWDATKELGVKKNRRHRTKNIELTDLQYKIVMTHTSTINYLMESKKSLVLNDKKNESFGERQCKISL